MNRTDLAYRRTAADGASGFGLLIALFDTLAGDLRRAAEAQRNKNIEWRCREVKHALLVIGHLEGWVNCGTGGELAQQLSAFYAAMRSRLIDAQVKKSAEILDELMADALKIRESWQQMDVQTTRPDPEIKFPAAQITPNYPAMQMETRQSSWSV